MDGDCWGYNDFVSLSDLPEFLNHGHLIFVVGIRNCSYYDVCETMRRYTRKLEDEKKVLEELLGGRNISLSELEVFSGDSSQRSSRVSGNMERF
jgi:esterase/lipase superfamily enzyme